MSLKEGLIGAVGLVLGCLIGYATNPGYLKGQLSACKDITGVMNAAIPAGLECSIDGNDVVITTPLAPGKKLHLDGKEAN